MSAQLQNRIKDLMLNWIMANNHTDMVLYATGRKANIKGLGLENTAVRLTQQSN